MKRERASAAHAPEPAAAGAKQSHRTAGFQAVWSEATKVIVQDLKFFKIPGLAEQEFWSNLPFWCISFLPPCAMSQTWDFQET
jgi:hypothetical protein